MNNKESNKICTFIIYLLTIILIILILYNMFLLITTSNKYDNTPHRNSIKVSPITNEKDHNAIE